MVPCVPLVGNVMTTTATAVPPAGINYVNCLEFQPATGTTFATDDGLELERRYLAKTGWIAVQIEFSSDLHPFAAAVTFWLALDVNA